MLDYDKLNAKMKPVWELLKNDKAKLAFNKLQYMINSGVFDREEMWYAYEKMGDIEYRMMNIEKAVAAYWQCINSTEGMPLRKQQEYYSNYLLMLHYLPQITDLQMTDSHMVYQQLCVHNPRYEYDNWKKHKKIRVGYIAARFVMNVVSCFSVHLLTKYDRNKFDVYVYSMTDGEDDCTSEIKDNVTCYRDLSQFPGNQEKADQIHKDEIDILFDLTGHTEGGRTLQIMSFKPAPVQISGIGYMSTTGLREVDYFLSDVFLDPLGEHDEQFSEKLIRLPHSHFCYMPFARALQRRTDYKMHTPIIFGCFNNFHKISDDMLAVWKQILDKLPGSKIIMKNSTMRVKNMSPLHARMKAAGYQKNQYEIESMTYNYFDKYMDIDIALDTYPYCGGGTTCDALFCGVPVITLCGTRHGSRFGYSLLKNVGLDELIAYNRDEYVQKAVALAKDRETLQALRDNLPLIVRKSPLMDIPQYVSEIEAVYEKIYADKIQEMSEK